MNQQRLKYLLEKIAESTASPEEHKEYDAWYERMQEENPQLYADPFSDDALAVRELMLQKINDEIGTYSTIKQPIPMSSFSRRLMVAASLLLGIVGAVFIYFYSFRHAQQHQTEVVRTHDVIDNKLVYIDNSSSVVRNVQLPDSSQVSIYPGSNISYHQKFEPAARRIQLNGKAFFQVSKDAAKPFTVTSNNISTTALGTSFTITAFKNKNEVEVILHTGKVVVRRSSMDSVKKDKEIYLTAGQQVQWNLSRDYSAIITSIKKSSPVKAKRHSDDIGSRKGYVTEFNQEPLAQVLDKIGKGFGVQINYRSSEIKDMFYSGKIRATDSLAEVLQRIAMLQDLQLKCKNQRYLLRKQF